MTQLERKGPPRGLPTVVLALILAVLMLTLTGCGTFKRPEPQERIVYKYIPVPVELTTRVSLPAPPLPEAYASLPWGDQESILTRLLQEHMEIIGVCNARLSGISDWSDRQYRLYQPLNNK